MKQLFPQICRYDPEIEEEMDFFEHWEYTLNLFFICLFVFKFPFGTKGLQVKFSSGVSFSVLSRWQICNMNLVKKI